jgi:hypothetical protein
MTGPNVCASTNMTALATAALADQRQRGDGSDPLGVSSRVKPMHTSVRKNMARL